MISNYDIIRLFRRKKPKPTKNALNQTSPSLKEEKGAREGKDSEDEQQGPLLSTLEKIGGTENCSEILYFPTATEGLRTQAEQLYKQRVKDSDKHLHVSEGS